MRGYKYSMHKPPEQRGCSQSGENKREGSLHRVPCYLCLVSIVRGMTEQEAET
jgi:hypothetical protein